MPPPNPTCARRGGRRPEKHVPPASGGRNLAQTELVIPARPAPGSRRVNRSTDFRTNLFFDLDQFGTSKFIVNVADQYPSMHVAWDREGILHDHIQCRPTPARLSG